MRFFGTKVIVYAFAADDPRSGSTASPYSRAVYDALIVAAAQDAGCERLFSEDLQRGQKFGMLTVENPFRGQPA